MRPIVVGVNAIVDTDLVVPTVISKQPYSITNLGDAYVPENHYHNT